MLQVLDAPETVQETYYPATIATVHPPVAAPAKAGIFATLGRAVASLCTSSRTRDLPPRPAPQTERFIDHLSRTQPNLYSETMSG